jgi:predicted RNase H-like HicB family nuclease
VRKSDRISWIEKTPRNGKHENRRKTGARRMNYHYSMVIQWSEEDRLFLVHLPEFPWQQFHTHGRTYEEAAKNGQEVIETFVEIFKEENKPLPEPRILPTKPLQVG